uniref:Small ribosomal subunit protein eS1 n=1 Tax=Strombidinopsis acuminata TaxID=141414 RepID=A0A7S3XAM7_9SPIT|mmetsp:Transcript_99990/g.137613  ORF Transcript_99990/g.137613 Transcript_99990/m.137613 type:complete len:255 (+) Transcript_99990:96-860(+)|eukprot:CAMPEP_0176360082 /NCGR_PEP_ID=MMETSP0126-20121128/16860_1 /TAXON_ID=141414 ORGANISM="Strombidinopsis acuminatum, Strain SPMC142" /NCGR_SAMPLE_ID=MMETSP0126 /ASSEMBLY_ACC=CAM_ASM_000229 /LENGTH=254 /DNA_ID=CAMNT_0017715219 /DNA_START=77 /DNA_END=841 /DNA_ORIENTATION=-
MTAGKNPRNFKKKGQKKKLVHPFIKKEWYNVHVPSVFDNRVPTLTPCNKTAGQKNSADSLRGRVLDISLGDLNREAHENAWRKVKVQVEEVKGFDCYTNFHGMDITRDKLCTLVKKWHTLIESFVQCKTLDGYLVRLFAIAFTRRQNKQVKATCYAKGSQRKLIRQKMMEIMVNEASKSTLKDLFKKLISESVGKEITKECSKIFPLQNVLVKKVKVLKKPKFDLTKLMELYQDKPEAPKAAAEDEAKNILAQE